MRQVSPESESIFDFIIELYNSSKGDWAGLQKKSGIAPQDLQHFLEYAAQFLGNCGNYKGFGDAKFVPRCGVEAFEALAATSTKAKEHYDATKGAIFSSDNSGIMHLGYLDQGHMTTYYPDSKDITKAEISAVSDFMEQKGLLVVSYFQISVSIYRSNSGILTVSNDHLRGIVVKIDSIPIFLFDSRTASTRD